MSLRGRQKRRNAGNHAPQPPGRRRAAVANAPLCLLPCGSSSIMKTNISVMNREYATKRRNQQMMGV